MKNGTIVIVEGQGIIINERPFMAVFINAECGNYEIGFRELTMDESGTYIKTEIKGRLRECRLEGHLLDRAIGIFADYNKYQNV